jgi:hypothetical protein
MRGSKKKKRRSNKVNLNQENEKTSTYNSSNSFQLGFKVFLRTRVFFGLPDKQSDYDGAQKSSTLNLPICFPSFPRTNTSK